jgi:hypothetical protein
MPENEELKLIVSLTDDASAGLAKLRAELTKTAEEAKKMQGSLSGGFAGGDLSKQKETVANFLKMAEGLKDLSGGRVGLGMERAKRGFAELAEAAKPLTKEFSSAVGAVGSLFQKLGPAGVTAAAFGGYIAKSANDMAKFSEEMNRLNQAARQTGLTAGSIQNLTDQLKRMGLGDESISRLLSGTSASMARFARDYSKFLDEIINATPTSSKEEMRKRMEDLLPFAKAGDEVGYLNRLRTIADEIEAANEKLFPGTTRGAQAKRQFLEMFGAGDLQLVTGTLKKATEDQIKLQDVLINRAKEYQKIISDLEGNWIRIKRVWDSTDIVTPPALKYLNEILERWAKALENKALIDSGQKKQELPPWAQGTWGNRPQMLPKPMADTIWPLWWTGKSLGSDAGAIGGGAGTPSPSMQERRQQQNQKPGFWGSLFSITPAHSGELPPDVLAAQAAQGGKAAPELAELQAKTKELSTLEAKIAEWGVWGALEAGGPALRALGMPALGAASAMGAGALNMTTIVFMKKMAEDIRKDARETGGIPKGSTGDAWGLFSWLMEQAKKTKQDFAPEEQVQERVKTAPFSDRFGDWGTQQSGQEMGHVPGMARAIDIDRFVTAINTWQESLNIEDRRGQSAVAGMTQAKQWIKDTITEVGRDLGFERFRAPIVPAGHEAGSALARDAGAFDIVLKEDVEQTKELTAEMKRLNDGLFLFGVGEGGEGGGGGGGAGGGGIGWRRRFGGGAGPRSGPTLTGQPGLGGGPGAAPGGLGAAPGGPGAAPGGPGAGPGGPGAAPGGAPPGAAPGTAPPGPGSPSGPGAPPSAIIDKAREVAAAEGAVGVKKFMAEQGYPQHDNWCGDFAASVVKAAGGTPPKNPWMASNWRNFGTKVEGAPQPGDIAVAKPGWSKRGSGQTGEPGSHVTIVDKGIDPKTGRFTGLGGNQSAGRRASFPGSKFDFYRSNVPVQAPGTQSPAPGAQPQEQAPTSGGAGALAQARSRYAEELRKDPDLARLLSASTNAEVGGQSKEAQQSYIESVMNRAAARGKTLRETLSDPSYYPKTTTSKLGARADTRAHAGIVADVLGGSDVSNLATGNESGTVRSGGAQVTRDFGPKAERFVREKNRRDQEFIRRMETARKSAAPPVVAQPGGKSGMLPTPSGDLPPLPEAIPLEGRTALTRLGARAAGSAYPLTEPGLAGTTDWNAVQKKPEIGIDPNQSYLSRMLAEQHELGHAGQKVLGEPGSDFLRERGQQFPEFDAKKGHEELRQRLSDQAALDVWRKRKGWSATRDPSYLKERSENRWALSKADPKTLDMLRRVNKWSEMKAEEALLPSLPPQNNFDPQTGRPVTGGYGPLPSLPTSDSIAMDRAAMDRAQGGVVRHTVNGEGKITVDVNAPSGTKVNAEGKGIFKEVETNRNMQMPQTSTGGEYAIQ